MKSEIHWHSQQGTKTDDNRDCAGVGVRAQDFLAVVADGSTKGQSNSEFARAFVQHLVDWFVGEKDPVTTEMLTAILRECHDALAPRFPRGSASYMIVMVSTGGPTLVGHAGDCVLGRVDGEAIVSWMSAPHTLANELVDVSLEDLAKRRARHLLTRSFRSKEFIPPAVQQFETAAGALLIATDGFWAELNTAQQSAFISQDFPVTDGDRDDRSILLIMIDEVGSPEVQLTARDSSGGLYVRHTA